MKHPIIITGAVNRGKTTFVQNLIQAELLRVQDGFFAPKVFDGGMFLGYDLVRIKNKHRHPWLLPIAPQNTKAPDFDRTIHSIGVNNTRQEGGLTQDQVGPFALEEGAMSFYLRECEDIKHTPTGPILLDEIGPWEMAGYGHDGLIRYLLGKDLALTLVIRSSLVDEIIKHYQLNQPTIIRVP